MVAFDFTGKMLGYCTESKVVVNTVKAWGEVASWGGHKKDVVGVGFGVGCEWVASGSMDKTVKFWGA